MNKKILIITIITMFVFGFLFMSCGNGEEEENNNKGKTNETSSDTDDAGNKNKENTQDTVGKKEVELSYVLWDSEIASTNVVKAVLQERMGYEVKLTAVDAGIMWKSMAESDADAMVAAWLPTTHGHYLEEVKDEVVNLGPNLEGTKTGLVVPTYVTLDSIEELNENADKFNGEIVGIGPDAGIFKDTNEAIEEYGLTNLKQTQGTDATMTGTLADAIKNKEWVVVTGWTPHWLFAKFDLKYLKDPKGVYGGEGFIATIARKGLKEDMPEVYKFLDAFKWSPNDMAQVMIWNQEEGTDPYDNAKRWVEENSDKVDTWLK